MTSRTALLGIIDEFKAKLTSEEYMRIVDELAKLDFKNDDEKRSDQLSTVAIPMLLTEKDLQHIGNGASKNFKCEKWNDGTSFQLDGNTSNIEQMMLRNILNGLGYEMDEGEDYVWTDKNGEDQFDINVCTSYPWSRYMKH